MKKIVYPFLLFFITVLTGCSALRAVRYGSPSENSYSDFALDTISCNDTARCVLLSADTYDRFFKDMKFNGNGLNYETVGNYFESVRGNGALLIVRNDTILEERYYGNFSRLSPASVFSISKIITSLLCGIAVDEGHMALSDPITRYIPELKAADAMFSLLTIEHLLDMRTGLDFKENYGWNPFSKMARLYYGKNVVGCFKKLQFKEQPGSSHYYNSMSTALLGVAIERAVGKPFASYLEEKVWKPLDMEADAYIALDDKKHRQAKAYGGLASNVRDLAKIGRLYINGGIYENKRIVSKEWVDRSIHSSPENNSYSLGWNNITTRKDGKVITTSRFFALGLYGQVLFCDPEQKMIFVTLGQNKGCEYQLLFDSLCNISKRQNKTFASPEK